MAGHALPRALAPLIRQRRWLIWRWQERDGKRIKPPISPTSGQLINAHDPRNWLTYEQALELARTVFGDGGLGFALVDSDIGAVDLDRCRDAGSGQLTPWAQRIVDQAAGGYIEVTPSGDGLRILGLARGAPVHTNWIEGGGRVELYRRARRYVTVTGAQFGSCRQLTEIDSLIDALLAARPQQKPAGKKRTVLKSTRTDVVELIKPSLLTPEQLVERYGLDRLLAHNLLHEWPNGQDRSAMLWKLANRLHRKGVHVRHAYTLLWFSNWNKHREQKHGRRTMTLMLRKIWGAEDVGTG